MFIRETENTVYFNLPVLALAYAAHHLQMYGFPRIFLLISVQNHDWPPFFRNERTNKPVTVDPTT